MLGVGAEAGAGLPTNPPSAKAGSAGNLPWFNASNNPTPHFCTAAALITYSPLDKRAKFESEVAVPFPFTYFSLRRPVIS